MDKIEEILSVDSNAALKFVKKGEIIQRQGELSSLAFHVKSGLLRSYLIDEKGKEHVFMFAPEGWIIADIESQEFKTPSELFIDCLEDAEIMVFDRKCFSKADLSSDQLKNNAHLLARRVAVLQSRVIMLMSFSAKKRYLRFIETYPDLPNRIPQRMIASYLGITPEALSKIRGEISRSK